MAGFSHQHATVVTAAAVLPLLLCPTDLTALTSCPATYIPLLGSEMSLSLHVRSLDMCSA